MTVGKLRTVNHSLSTRSWSDFRPRTPLKACRERSMVMECTANFLTTKVLQLYLDGGVKRVVVRSCKLSLNVAHFLAHSHAGSPHILQTIVMKLTLLPTCR
mmetsp:Transcript_4941/g.10047  ORF Transcript_4941/g.10047 Transcript_4941/m.10047 type:complete len:101 (-) Transcript_4941:243-545(-)